MKSIESQDCLAGFIGSKRENLNGQAGKARSKGLRGKAYHVVFSLAIKFYGTYNRAFLLAAVVGGVLAVLAFRCIPAAAKSFRY